MGRLRGYRRALAAHQIATEENLILEAGHEDASGYQTMHQLLEDRPRPDGVFCFNDPVAVGAMRAILEGGFSIPEDMAIVGAANMHYSDILRIPLSTVDQGTTEMGDKAATLLLACMASKKALPPRQLIVPPRLIVRASSTRRARPA